MCRKKFQITATAFDKRGRVISRATNDYNKSNTWQKSLSLACGFSEERIYLHSEVLCLLRAKGKQVHTLKVERYGAGGEPRVAFPCLSCQLAIKQSSVKRVVFTTEEGFKEYLV